MAEDTTTILETPANGGKTFMFERRPSYGCNDGLEHEISAWGRANASDLGDVRAEIGSAKFDVASRVSSSTLETMHALARGEAATADRIWKAAGDATDHVVHGIDVTRESAAKIQHELSDIRVEQAEQEGRVFARLAEFEHRAALAYMEKFGALELRIAKEGSKTRERQLESSCEIKALVISENAKTREQFAAAQLAALERENNLLQMKLAVGKKILP